jgi:hypothetical protein
MIVKVKHEIPRDLAKEKIKQFLEETVQKYQGLIGSYELNWKEYSCDIKLSAMKMQLKGSLVIGKNDVEVDLNVPLIFYSYQSKIKSVIEDELNKILQ